MAGPIPETKPDSGNANLEYDVFEHPKEHNTESVSLGHARTALLAEMIVDNRSIVISEIHVSIVR